MVGAKPKPTILKRLAGTLQPCRTNQHEAQPRACSLYTPRHLSAGAKAHWRKLAPMLARAGLLTEVDVPALERMCELHARVAEASKLVAKGLLIKTTNGNLVQNPALGIVNRAYDLLGRLEAEFGMTPSSRSRIVASPVVEEQSLADALFAGAIAEADREDG